MFAHASPRALRAFVEVARRGGIARAARMLDVSPSAVSHLMRELEASLGLTLFRPGTRRSVLTPAGERLALGIGDAFDTIERAVADLGRGGGDIRLSTLSTFATLWLVPRLARMQQALPGLRVLIATEMRPVDLATEPFDCAIRWGRGNWPGVVEVPLLREVLIAVAGPALLPDGPVTPSAFLQFPRIAARSRPDDWPRLLTAMGVTSKPAAGGEPGLVFETRGLAVRAAIAGLGVAVVDRRLVEDILQARHLIQATSVSVERPEAHFFVARAQALRDPNLRRFRDWIVNEANSSG